MLMTSAVAIFLSWSSRDTLSAPIFLYFNPAGCLLDEPQQQLLVVRLMHLANDQRKRPTTDHRLVLIFYFLLRRRVIHFHACTRPQRSQHFVAAGNDLVTRLDPAQDFDVGRPSDAGLDRQKFGLAIADDKYALNLFLVVACPVGCFLARSGDRCSGLDGIFLAASRLQLSTRTHSQSLYRDGEDLGAR